MKKIILTLMAVLAVLIIPSAGMAATTQVDALIEKLVEKGILDKKEAIKLKGEIAADEKIVREEGLKQSLPEWVQKLKLKGDFRLRYQYERNQANTDARERGRIRYRLGLESDITKSIKVGAGLTSGADDPRSTNQSFTDTFEHSDIRLDYAYAEYRAIEEAKDKLKLIGGQFNKSDYLWNATDIFWDTDINPQGGALHYEHNFNDTVTAYVNGGVFILDENTTVGGSAVNDKPDPFMDYVQGGIKAKKGALSANVAAIYYSFNALKGSCPDWSSATNTGITTSSSGSCSSGSLKFDYDSFGTSAQVALAKPFGENLPIAIEEVSVFGDYIYNIDNNNDEDNNLDDPTGWAIGMAIGDPKVNGKNQWQAKYIYGYLGKDSWPDFLPDSDRLGGRTDMRSHEMIFEYGLTKNVTVGLDYYQSERIKTTKNIEHLIQTDLNLKF